METALRRISVAATIGMFFVLLMGATVTNTGSGEGCGNSWPLCNGRFVPSYAFHTLIEFSHRLVTGGETFLILGTAVLALRLRPRRRDIRLLVALMVGTLFLQAGMGAWAVKADQSAAVLALHFGFSLLCLASTFTVAMEVRRGPDPRAMTPPAPPRFGRMVWSSLAVLYAVAYLGAYVRRAKAELGCGQDWPRCNGKLVGAFSGAEGIHFAHRSGAVLAALVIAGLILYAARFREQRPDIFRGTLVAGGLIVAMSAAGGAVVREDLATWATLAHAGLMGLLFVALCDVARRTMVRSAAAATRPAPQRTASLPVPAGD